MIWKDEKKKKVYEKMEYVIVDYPETGKTFGSFQGSSPKQAATKAFTRLAKISQLNNSKRELLVFVVRNQQTGKEYKYIGSRIKLAKPRKVSISGKEIVYRYKNIIGKYRDELNKIQE